EGYFDQNASKAQRGHSYLFEFTDSGTLVRKSLNKAQERVGQYLTNRAADNAIAEDDAGRTYLLQPDRILVISPIGVVERTINVLPKDAEYWAYKLYLSEGRLAVAFESQAESQTPGAHLKPSYALLDAASGRVLRRYQPDPELGNSLVCF